MVMIVYLNQSLIPQVSGDEQRRLCGEQAKYSDRTSLGLGMGLTTYGSVAYQLKDANMEASGTVDFVCRAAKIMNRTSKCFVYVGTQYCYNDHWTMILSRQKITIKYFKIHITLDIIPIFYTL